MEIVICPYCKNEAIFTTGRDIYPHRPDLYERKFYLCSPCDAYVGVHTNSLKPLGRLANAELRAWKSKAHTAFDPLWKRKMIKDSCSKTKARKAGYKWLSGELGVEPKDCHIGMFDVDMCKRVVGACIK